MHKPTINRSYHMQVHTHTHKYTAANLKTHLCKGINTFSHTLISLNVYENIFWTSVCIHRHTCTHIHQLPKRTQIQIQYISIGAPTTHREDIYIYIYIYIYIWQKKWKKSKNGFRSEGTKYYN